VVKPRLERIPGVASVDVRGARDREIRVDLETEALASLQLSPLDIVESLRRENLTVPAGPVESGEENLLVRPMSEFRTLQDIEQALIARRGSHAVQLHDVATVRDGFEDYVNVVRINGDQGVEITITKSPDANTVEVADAIRAAILDFNGDFEGRAALDIVIDTSTFIRRSIEEVQSSVVIGGALAILVLLVFLRSIRATLVVATSIPIAVIGTFFLMYQLGLTLNLISFGGLALGLGMLVDNAPGCHRVAPVQPLGRDDADPCAVQNITDEYQSHSTGRRNMVAQYRQCLCASGRLCSAQQDHHNVRGDWRAGGFFLPVRQHRLRAASAGR